MSQSHDSLDNSKYDFDDQFQRQIIKLLIGDSSFLKRHQDTIKSSYFSEEIHQILVEAILLLYHKYKIVPTKASLLEALKKAEGTDGFNHEDFSQEVQQIWFTPFQGELVEEAIIEFAQKQAFEEVLMDAPAMHDAGDYGGIRDSMQKALLVGQDYRNKGYNWKNDPKSRIEQFLSPVKSGNSVPTGISQLDEVLDGGGLNIGELGVVLAPPNKGKTTVLIQMGANAMLLGKNVLHVSLEISEQKVAVRYDMRLLGMSKKEMRETPQEVIDQLQDLKDSIPGNLNISVFPPSSLTPVALDAVIDRQINEGCKPDMLIVDYGMLMKCDSSTLQLREQIADTYSELRRIAVEKQIPVWSAVQANRGALDEDITNIGIEHIAECFAVGHHSDVIISIHQSLRMMRQKRGFIFVAKNREEESGLRINVGIDWSKGLITDYNE